MVYSEASRALTTLLVRYMSILTGESSVFPLSELLRRVADGDVNVLSPVMRADGGESERRRAEVIRILVAASYIVLFFPLEPQFAPLRVVLVKWKAFAPVCKTVVGDVDVAQYSFRLRAWIQRKLLGNAYFLEKDIGGMIFEWCGESAPPPGATSIPSAPLSDVSLPTISVTLASSAQAVGNSSAVPAPAAANTVSASAAVADSTPTLMDAPSGSYSHHFVQKQLLPLDPALVGASSLALFPDLLAHHAACSGWMKNPTLSASVSRIRAGGLSEATFMLLTLMMERDLKLSPFSDMAVLEEALSLMTPFYLWPQPYGARAFHMLKIMSREVKCPGVLWRREIERAFPQLVHRTPHGKELEAVLLAPPDSALARMLKTYRMAPLSDLDVLRGSLLCLYRAAGISTDLFEKRISTFGLKKLRALYDRTRDAMELAMEISSNMDAAVYFEQRLDQLRRAAEKHSQGKETPRDPSGQLLCGMPWQYRVLNVSDATSALRELILEYGKLESDVPVTLRVLIEGGDREFHQVVLSWVAVNTSLDTAELLRKRVKLSFFVLSTRNPCVLARTMSNYDPWFGRRTVTAVRALASLELTMENIAAAAAAATATTAPTMTSTNNDAVADSANDDDAAATATATVAADDDGGTEETVSSNSFLRPAFLLHFTLGEYLGLALHRNEFQVWQCECWQRSPTASDTSSSSIARMATSNSAAAAEGPASQVIPFILSASLGRTAQSRLFQTSNDLSLNLMGDIARSSCFKFKAPIVALKVVGVTLRGKPKERTDYEARPWEEVTFNVVPDVAAPGGASAPRFGTPWMQMSAQQAGDPVETKKKKKQMGTRTTWQQDARRVEIHGHKASLFEIMLDGVSYGNLTKVVISPWCIGDSAALDRLFLSFPIRCFSTMPGGTLVDE